MTARDSDLPVTPVKTARRWASALMSKSTTASLPTPNDDLPPSYIQIPKHLIIPYKLSVIQVRRAAAFVKPTFPAPAYQQPPHQAFYAAPAPQMYALQPQPQPQLSAAQIGEDYRGQCTAFF
ncbi:hypothetical protein B0H17DRAFT_1147294 [Mycena rosella]|uniref:Uncharacterized protein n=1 Tax=Mycena rosella TaxID=1033263 RepID=A0AAD7CLZ4_MYCRO|nr:hypothetical protein B0H17DRAFT_1147294 [Mycena rosella]